jgi:hypothetical protein
MRLWRVFPWDPGAAPRSRGHAFWVPQTIQGASRHDNPDLYGAVYLSENAVAAIAEHLVHLRGQLLEDGDLERSGLRLALTSFEAPIEGRLWDLDDPPTLVDRRLRPSQVATRSREVTRRQAADLFRARPRRDGIRWWSTLEASWIHVTLFDRALGRLSLAAEPESLRIAHPAVRAAAKEIGVLVR